MRFKILNDESILLSDDDGNLISTTRDELVDIIDAISSELCKVDEYVAKDIGDGGGCQDCALFYTHCKVMDMHPCTPADRDDGGNIYWVKK